MTFRLRVAVCTNRRAAELAECLAALVREVGPEDVIVVTSGLPAALVEEHRATSPGVVLVEPSAGLSRARNRAIAASGQDDVVAFVDDDVVVDAGWGEALRRHWTTARSDVGCIGGPIRPDYRAPPPPWLSDSILPVLTVLDLGAAVRTLDPSATTVYGANISFRVGPLCAAGGFDPAFGHRAGRPMFSEEDQAQRALARLGYRTLYVPDAGVRHMIPAARLTRGSFLRRRLAYGEALGRRGARSRSIALRQLLRSSAGAAAAGARGADALFMERAVRAAENLGVILAPLLRLRA